MLVNMIDMLAKAAAEGYGVGNFDVFNTELLKGVMEAAEEANAPVILAYGPPFEKYSPLKYFAPAVKAWAADTDLPVVLHYDHGTSLEGCVHAVECGCNSIMIDASSKPFEENVKTVREVVDFCHPRGIPVEAELGHVGDEGEYSL
ncbi:MAG: class II fructose-bisphosphate aldolase, partial [Firmicutes bacterium]|nr:class II fructose-bisphosphate aldolase [Bacillota bacterium]